MEGLPDNLNRDAKAFGVFGVRKRGYSILGVKNERLRKEQYHLCSVRLASCPPDVACNLPTMTTPYNTYDRTLQLYRTHAETWD